MFSSDEINSLINKLIQKYEPEKLIIFGSYANNTANKDSDLDLLIIKNTNENFYQRSLTVRKLLRPNNIPTDIFVFTPLEFEEKKTMINHIAFIANKYGKLIYNKNH